MTDTSHLPNFTDLDMPDHVSVDAAYANRFTEATLVRHKREGLDLAVRARWAALAVVAILLPFLNWDWEVLYYEAMLIVVAGVGWLQMRVGRVGLSRPELAVLALDLSIMVFILVMPNPFGDRPWPTTVYFQFDTFQYLFLILALGTLCYSWRTIMAIGNWTAMAWFVAVGLVWWLGNTVPDLTVAAQEAFGDYPELARLFDPNVLHWDIHIQQVVVFWLVAAILALSVRRFNRLLLSNATLERERENLARYFSPNVVSELSQNDEPLKQIRSHDVAVVFVDIQKFTTFASKRAPEEVIGTLRDFHARMERAVFAHAGTLDKYLGDGLMATFGTPSPAPDDMRRAYHCARRMVTLAAEWNTARKAAGQDPLDVSIGVHVGPVVLGDIGGNRLEFAVIGNTVNVASRLEALTRPLKAHLVISDDLHSKLPDEEVADLERHDGREIRGIDGTMTVWALPRTV